MTPKQFKRISEELERISSSTDEFELSFDSQKLVIKNKSEPIWLVLLWLVVGIGATIVLIRSEEWFYPVFGLLFLCFWYFRLWRILSMDQLIIFKYHEKVIEFTNQSILKNLIKPRILKFADLSDFEVKLISYNRWMPPHYTVYIRSHLGKKYPLSETKFAYAAKRLKHLIRMVVQH